MTTAVIRRDWIGQVIDERFLLLEWLGGTEQASVFRTRVHGGDPQRAAIKLMLVDDQHAQDQMERWEAAANLSHPHLMRIFGTGQCRIEDADLIYAVMEHAEESLAQVLPERTLTPDEARDMLNPVVDALEYLHERGLVHGHVKPSNIMVAEESIKLPVEGVYREGESARPDAQLRIYDAPEVAAGGMSSAADIWSLGITLVEALTQIPPLWDRSTNRDPFVSEAMDQPFLDIARGCLHYEPAARLRLRDIKALLDPAPRLAPANTIDEILPPRRTAPPAEAPKARRISYPVGVIVAVGVLLGVLSLMMWSHKPQVSPPPRAEVNEPARPPAPAQPAPSAAAPTQATPPAGAAAPTQPETPANSDSGTHKAEIVERVMPELLPSAVATIHGKVSVQVRVSVDTAGAVSDAKFDSPGPSRYFATKALEAALKWRFTPARADGQPVASVWTLRFRFRQSGAEVDAHEVSPQ